MKKLFKVIFLILILVSLTIIITLEYNTNAKKIPVITFHRIVSDNIKNTKYKDNKWVGSISTFDSMMKYIHDNNYQTLSSRDLYDWLTNKKELPKKSVMITFDDGFYEDYYLVYPILKKYNLKAISFVVGRRINNITLEYDEDKTSYIGLDKINEIRNDYPNFEIQSHSYDLHYYNEEGKHIIKNKTYDELIKDIELNKEYNFNVMAYPFGDYNDNIKKALKDENYLMAFRFSPSGYVTKNSDLYAIPRIKMDGEKTLKDLKKWLY